MDRITRILERVAAGESNASDAESLREVLAVGAVKRVALENRYAELHRAARDVCAYYGAEMDVELPVAQLAQLIGFPGYGAGERNDGAN